jgi:hypothetical protein
MINEGADLSEGYQKTEESATPVYRPVRSGLTDSTGTGTGHKKTWPVPSLVYMVNLVLIEYFLLIPIQLVDYQYN